MASATEALATEDASSWRISLTFMNLFGLKKKPSGDANVSAGNRSSSPSVDKKLDTKDALAIIDKLKGYHDLAKAS